jgi:hypothetical protein
MSVEVDAEPRGICRHMECQYISRSDARLVRVGLNHLSQLTMLTRYQTKGRRPAGLSSRCPSSCWLVDYPFRTITALLFLLLLLVTPLTKQHNRFY